LTKDFKKKKKSVVVLLKTKNIKEIHKGENKEQHRTIRNARNEVVVKRKGVGKRKRFFSPPILDDFD